MAVAETAESLSKTRRVSPWFRGLSVATAISALALVVLGGVVRVTGSGLGCPDWPLCHGGLLPPWELTAVIEYTHRIVASLLVGPLVLITVGLAWIGYRRERWVVITATSALLLLLGQALLGGAAVLNELPGSIVAAHLALGQALLVCLILVAVLAYRGPPQAPRGWQLPNGRTDRFPVLLLAAAAGVYGLLISGSIVTVTGATGACLDWPLCQGDVIPEHRLQAIHMSHRWVAAIIGLFVMYVLHLGIRQRYRPSYIRLLSTIAAGLFVAQVLVGAGAVWLDFSVEFRALHLAMATITWAAIALLGLLMLTSDRSQQSERAHA